MNIKIKRVYELATPGDGSRVLVDRLWPRGLTKEAAAIDEWTKDLAPRTALRQWFGLVPARWPEFRRRYVEELDDRRDEMIRLRRLAKERGVTLVYGARDEIYNGAVVLRDVLLG